MIINLQLILFFTYFLLQTLFNSEFSRILVAFVVFLLLKMADNISVNFILEGTKEKKDGTYPIKLNVYNKDIGQKRYGTKLSATKADWAKLEGRKLRGGDLKTLKIKLEEKRLKAITIIDALPYFSFANFEKQYFEHDKKIVTNSISLQALFDDYVSKLKNNDQIGSASSYKTTINSINHFKKNLTVFDVTPEWLQKYENHLTAKGKSISTVGVYMRQLRAIINAAINEKILPAENYPFKKYQVPSGRNIKKALPVDDLKKILTHVPKEESQKRALDFWKLSYYCNGINFTDIAHLKRDAYDGKFFHFYREKTKRTKKRDLRPIRVAVNDPAKEIIELYKSNDSENPFLFSILESGLNAITTKNRCQCFVKWTNKHLEEIRKKLKIDQKIGTYNARHSFSTTLMRKGVPISFIKDSLGHSSVTTTENYLDSFEDEAKIEYSNLLTDI